MNEVWPGLNEGLLMGRGCWEKTDCRRKQTIIDGMRLSQASSFQVVCDLRSSGETIDANLQLRKAFQKEVGHTSCATCVARKFLGVGPVYVLL